MTSKIENGAFQGGVYRSRDRGESWERAMGRGINTETRKADQWAYGPIAQYQQVLTTDTKPLTVYVANTSTGFHPPHHDTVYRSDDGGETWRDTYFMDPRFERYNVAPNYVTASTGQSWKGGEAPFGVAICNTDPERVILVRSQCYVTHDGGDTWFNGHTYPAPGQTPKPGCAWVCNGLVVTTTWHYYFDPFDANRRYIAYTDIGMARSLDGGETWIWWDKQSWAPWRNTCYEIAFDPETPGKMWGVSPTCMTSPTITSSRSVMATTAPAACACPATTALPGSMRLRKCRSGRRPRSCSTPRAPRHAATPVCRRLHGRRLQIRRRWQDVDAEEERLGRSAEHASLPPDPASGRIALRDHLRQAAKGPACRS